MRASPFRDRLAFWLKLHDRLARLSNCVDAAMQAIIFGKVQRIPMVPPAEQRAVQLESAKADARFWSTCQGFGEEQAGRSTTVRAAQVDGSRPSLASVLQDGREDVSIHAASDAIRRILVYSNPFSYTQIRTINASDRYMMMNKGTVVAATRLLGAVVISVMCSLHLLNLSYADTQPAASVGYGGFPGEMQRSRVAQVMAQTSLRDLKAQCWKECAQERAACNQLTSPVVQPYAPIGGKKLSRDEVCMAHEIGCKLSC